MGGALLCGLPGLALLLIAAYDPRDEAFPSGRGVVYLAGTVFLLAAAAIAVPTLSPTARRDRLQKCIGALLLLALLSVPVFIAFPLGARSRVRPSPVTYDAVQISLDREVFYGGDVIEVRLDRPLVVPADYHALVCVAKPDDMVGTMWTWVYLPRGATNVQLRLPYHPGTYEVRLQPHLNLVLFRKTIDVQLNPAFRPEQDAAPDPAPVPEPPR